MNPQMQNFSRLKADDGLDDDDEEYHPTYQSDSHRRSRPGPYNGDLHDLDLMPDLEHDPRFTTDGDFHVFDTSTIQKESTRQVS
jgi:hypothetical protein